jgi:hypothetical protein
MFAVPLQERAASQRISNFTFFVNEKRTRFLKHLVEFRCRHFANRAFRRRGARRQSGLFALRDPELRPSPSSNRPY